MVCSLLLTLYCFFYPKPPFLSSSPPLLFVQLGGMRGGCVAAYAAFREKWAEQLAADVTEDMLTQHSYTSDNTLTQEELESKVT